MNPRWVRAVSDFLTVFETAILKPNAHQPDSQT